MSALHDLEFGTLYLALMGIVFARAQATYWVGRLAGTGARRFGAVRRIESRRVSRAEHLLTRYGAPAVTLSFLTVGLQTALNCLAGVGRMPFVRYLFFMLPGCAAWALIYATIGMAALWAWVDVVPPSAWGTVATIAVLAVIAAIVVLRRKRTAH
ncbi:DedA family protein [Spelaeicoccus albus]|uniref:Membrane protein DedA with SNARE-associated domain n=1 Tax=Spelaeicoccus albus TaxID=1280376 RepID=A0A7Z0D2E0_9MICO|nr:VTT domain-containing protein [Spelaeicoccus albus]NYI67591.1 membrane protein DedA with SNARE-associated domain [Spelaeicoccus albus]